VNALSTTRPEAREWRPSRKFTVRERLTVGVEVLAAYIKVRYVLVRYRALPDALAVLRRPPRSVRAHGWRSSYEAGFRLGQAAMRTLAILPTDARCLMQSLVLVVLLNRRGIAVDVVIGVKSENRFAAHAWVEHEGHSLLPPGLDFARLGEF
jgi:hypothetical protein